VERKHRCVNFRRVSDLGRAGLQAFRVTGSADDKPGTTWVLGAAATILDVPATWLGAPQITVEQCWKIHRNAAGSPGDHSSYLSFNDF
jgi:hypothetical protein